MSRPWPQCTKTPCKVILPQEQPFPSLVEHSQPTVLPRVMGGDQFGTRPPLLRAPRVAIVYSGRLHSFDQLAVQARSHMEHLIRPNNASVFLTVDPTTWCDATTEARNAYRAGQLSVVEAELQKQVHRLFDGWPSLHVAFTPAEDIETPHQFGVTAMRYRAPSRARIKADYLHKWVMQFDHHAKVEALRAAVGDEHDVVVRARIDLVFFEPLLVWRSEAVPPTTDNEAIVLARPVRAEMPSNRSKYKGYELGSGRYCVGCFSHLDCHANDVAPWRISYGMLSHAPKWNQWGKEPCDPAATDFAFLDWLFIGTPRSLAPLATMTAKRVIYHSTNARCFGMCQEEQTVMHMQSQGVRLIPLRIPIDALRPRCTPRAKPLLNASEITRMHKITDWYNPCSIATKQCARHESQLPSDAAPAEPQRKGSASS